MMKPYQAIFELLDKENSISILTPNRRLAATLHKLYQEHHSAQQHECWLTPDILPLNIWIQRLWDNYTHQTVSHFPLLLTPTQECYLWEKVLLKTKVSHYLLKVSETADLARSAWGLLKQWQVDLKQAVFTSTEDYAALLDWINDFQNWCHENQRIDSASLPEFVTEQIKLNNILPAKHIVLVGFTEIAPQLQQLLDACKTNGCVISHLQLQSDQTTCHRISLNTNEDEILTMARWAKHLHAQGKQLKIGCVVPNLDKNRDRVAQVFSEVFCDTNAELPFNISAGKSLTQYSIIYTALHCLGLFKKTLTLDSFSFLLSTPFIGAAEQERLKRYKYDRKLRQDNVTQMNLTQLQQRDSYAYQDLQMACPKLAEHLCQFLTLLREQQNKKLTYHEWAVVINTALTTLGWPGERSLNSMEYQIVEAWLDLLSELTTLDQITHAVDYEECFHTLQKMATNLVFQAKTPATPIQVLGVLEAAALPFDRLWISGMDDMAWPPQPKPNPLIPKAIQRELHMPHATAERELTFCRIMLDQFKQGAANIIFSHAEKADELELEASPLIRDLPSLPLQDLSLADYVSNTQQIYAAKQLETITDDIAPPIKDNETIRGGVSILKQQALCPFKAYAEWRLHAREMEQPLPGLRARDRGEIIHKILELIWNKLLDHAGLVALSDAELTQCIQTYIEEALQQSAPARQEHPQYLALEKQRLVTLLYDWLQIEKQRPAFKVATHEKVSQITVGPLQLNIRIDRIDQLADGTKIIIDYKTGKYNDINNWFSPRPEEPQLPLYSLLDRSNTTAISFAQIAQGENCFKGVSRYALDIKGIKLIPEINKATTLSWEQQLAQWDAVLTQLSQDFHAGIAKVDPKEAHKTCEWCSLQSLCRIQEEA